MTAQKKTIRLQYVRSKICTPVKHKKVVKGLGFTRLYQVVEREDTPSIRGMVFKVQHLIHQQTVKEDPKPRKRMKSKKIRQRDARVAREAKEAKS